MEANILLAIFVLLTATVALVPLAQWLGLGTILGYLAAGVLIGPFGLRLVSDTEAVRAVSEFGVVMMLFLIGLELQPRELWRMRLKVFGLGVPQLAVTSGLIAATVSFAGRSWPEALIIGLALSMSSTAIAMQIIAQRNLVRSDTGRSSLAILLVQDVAVIPILAAIPLLAFGPAEGSAAVENVESAASSLDWLTAAGILAAFGIALVAGRYLVRPLFFFVAKTQVREAFTALALALVVGAALLTELVGLSPALGAFLGGVLLADSEYRHELQSNIAPFQSLLLGLFFISVGMSIAFDVLFAQPLLIGALVLALVTVKTLVLLGLGLANRLPRPERLLVAVVLSQAGEFAFVLLGFALSAGALSQADYSLLTVVVALSMATTPLLVFAFDRLVAPHLNAAAAPPMTTGYLDSRQKVVVLGYGRFGQIITRLLRSQGFEMTLIDDDPAQIELMRRFGVKVFYGDGSRLDLLHAAGAAQAHMIIIAVAGRERISLMAENIRREFPKVKLAARAVDRSHAHELIAIGVDVFERETFRSALTLGMRALVALGYTPDQAQRLGEAFAAHDNKLLFDSYALRDDEEAYVGFVRQSVDMLGDVLRADTEHNEMSDASSQPAVASPAEPIDKPERTGAV